MGKNRQCFFNAVSDAKGDKEKMWPSWRKNSVSFFAEVGPDSGREIAAEYVIEDAGQAEAGWKLFPEVLSKICANFEEGKARFQRRTFCDVIQLVTANINREFGKC